MLKKHARTKAVITVLAAKFPKCFRRAGHARPALKVGIDADAAVAAWEHFLAVPA
jgi:sRNA-binding protein